MASNTYKNHEKLYLTDGNIALLAPRSPGDFVVFRVHQSVLSRISPVFESMFTLPTGHAEEKYDGVPLVYVPDCADSMENLLMIVYHESALPFKRLDPRTPYSVKPILSLANKYGMDQLRHRIVEHFEGDWPRSLWQWDKLEFEIKSMLHTRMTGCYFGSDIECHPIDDHLPEPASAIRLGRECDVSSILPAAFYHLSRLSIYDDREEVRLRHDADDDELSGGRRTAEWRLLENEDFISLLKGREKLAVAANEMLCFTDCQQEEHWSDACSASNCWELLQEIRDACRHSSDILRTTRCYIEKGTYGEDICQLCCVCIRKELISFRQQLWDKLPDFFGLK